MDKSYLEWHKIDIVVYKNSPLDSVISYRTFSRNYSDAPEYKKTIDEQNLDVIKNIFQYELSNIDEKNLIEEAWDFKPINVPKATLSNFTPLTSTINLLTRQDIEKDDIRQTISEISKTINSLLTIDKKELSEQEQIIEIINTIEHRNYLQQAFKAKDRLLIVSPWITKYVVNDDFLIKLEEVLRRNVKVHILYGIKERFGQSQNDEVAIEKLGKLSKNYNNFIFKKVNNTHAKNLVSDAKFAIVSSFNFLSFRGDPNLTYRGEVGVVIRDKVAIDNLYRDRLLLIS